MQVCYTHPDLATMMLRTPGDDEDPLNLQPLSHTSMTLLYRDLHPVARCRLSILCVHRLQTCMLVCCGAENVRVSLIHLLVQQGSLPNLLQRTWLRCTQVITSSITQSAMSVSRICMAASSFTVILSMYSAQLLLTTMHVH